MTSPRGRTILTRTGRLVHPLDLSADEVDVVDMAWALAGEGRFSNQACETYSVAQHSVQMAEWALDFGYPDRVVYQCLLHDAPEAYLADVATPVKAVLPEYKAAERRAWLAICKALGCDPDLAPEVKALDARAFRTELRDLFPDYVSDETAPPPTRAEPMPDPLPGAWPRREAFLNFLTLYALHRPPGSPRYDPALKDWVLSGRPKRKARSPLPVLQEIE